VLELEPQILLTDKPLKATSFDVVAVIRNSLTKELGLKVKVSHTGTLDPLATGVLAILVGQATKAQDLFLKKDKEYLFTLQLGAQTETGDKEGEVIKTVPVPSLNEVQIHQILTQFIGHQQQTVPLFSAVQVNGKRLYKYARANKSPGPLPVKRIEIFNLKLISFNKSKNELKLRVKCSAGTYVRSLAEDIAKELKTVGHVTRLRRIASGEFFIKDCTKIRLQNTNLFGRISEK